MPGNEIGETEALLGLAQRSGEAFDAAVKAQASLKTGRDRSLAAWVVIGVYAAAVLAFIGYLIDRGICCREETYSEIAEVIKTAVLPVVTLVIGYYFGSSK